MPVVVWAASDGVDAEIWMTARRAGRWTAPTALSANSVPDITPSVTHSNGTTLVAWSAFAPSGYVIMARSRGPANGWERAVQLSPEPGVQPVAMGTASGPAVVWSAPKPSAAPGRLLRSAVRGSAGWGPQSDLAETGGSPGAATAARDGRLLMAWTAGDGSLEVAEAHTGIEAGATGITILLSESIRPTAAISAGPGVFRTTMGAASASIPHAFTAFGDSITDGIVIDGPNEISTPGYRAPLRKKMRSVLGPVSVPNQGVDGETTAAGLDRISSAVNSTDPGAIQILEGTNDVTLLVDAETITFNLRNIVKRALDEKEGVLVFLGLLPARSQPLDGFGGPFNARTDKVNEMLPSVADKTGAVLVDLHTPLDNDPSLFSNKVHPNEEGYARLGEAWFEAIRPVVVALTNRGDLDGSGQVDDLDLMRLNAAFGSKKGRPRFDAAADINGDDIVDGFDLALLAEFFGQSL
ncbi:MAG: GDSL-type esterase/lipase family protein, partial [Acidobacteriota bacterium]